jgi:hypothetical protein
MPCVKLKLNPDVVVMKSVESRTLPAACYQELVTDTHI